MDKHTQIENTSDSQIYISAFLPEHYRQDASNLLFDAFKDKFKPLDRDPEALIKLLEQNITEDRCIIASVDGQLAGIIGVNYDNIAFFDYSLQDICKFYGSIKGFFYWFLLKTMHHRPSTRKKIWVEGLAIAPTFRGQGIGQKLLYEVSKIYGKKGFKNLWIEVANKNTAAIRLYQRSGFRIMKTYRIHIFADVLGFDKVFCMKKTIK